MLTTLIASVVLGAPTPPPLSCPVMGNKVSEGQVMVDYNGVRVSFCCAGCDASFEKDPAKYLANTKGKTVGTFLFDPVARTRIVPNKAEGGWSDYKGIRFFFTTAANKAAFDKDPGTYGVMPKQEALQCPVSREKMKSYLDAWAYQDVKGVRYYICCGGCVPTFAGNPGNYTPGVAAAVAKPKAYRLNKEEAEIAKTGECGDHPK